MKQVLLACRNETVAARLRRVLLDGGIPVAGSCTTGADALIAARRMSGGGVLVCAGLTDQTPQRLAELLPEGFETVLLLASGQTPPLSAGRLIPFYLPLSRVDFLSTIRILAGPPVTQRGGARPQRERELIEQAKAVLMERHHLSEQDAHRLLQRRSMETGVPLARVARLLLEEP